LRWQMSPVARHQGLVVCVGENSVERETEQWNLLTLRKREGATPRSVLALTYALLQILAVQENANLTLLAESLPGSKSVAIYTSMEALRYVARFLAPLVSFAVITHGSMASETVIRILAQLIPNPPSVFATRERFQRWWNTRPFEGKMSPLLVGLPSTYFEKLEKCLLEQDMMVEGDDDHKLFIQTSQHLKRCQLSRTSLDSLEFLRSRNLSSEEQDELDNKQPDGSIERDQIRDREQGTFGMPELRITPDCRRLQNLVTIPEEESTCYK